MTREEAAQIIEDAWDRRIRRDKEADIRDVAVDAILAAVAASEERAAELQRTFDLRYDADMRAIKRWQAAGPNRELIWPDRADMVVFLLEREEGTVAAERERCAAIAQKVGGKLVGATVPADALCKQIVALIKKRD